MAKVTTSAKNTGLKINARKNDDEEIEPVEEVSEVSEETVEDTPASADGFKMIRVAVNTEINPAPRVGIIDMVRDYGMEKLKPGVHSLPEPVALVLVDKKLAQFV